MKLNNRDDTIARIFAERVKRQQATDDIQKEQNRIRSAERFKRKFYSYFPDDGSLRRELYTQHVKFFEAGGKYRERAFVAANRVGKTDAGSYELTCHLTGEYPKWWTGRKFDRPVTAWVAGTTNTTVRDILQNKLLGRLKKSTVRGEDDVVVGRGTGMIPGANILDTRPRSGIPDAVELIYVKHKTGGTSIVQFKSYESGRKSFEGVEQDILWLDEEPELDIYTECLMRTMTNNGIVMLTMTPLMGLSSVVLNFLPSGQLPPDGLHEGRYVVMCDWDQAPHLTEEAKKELWASIPPYQRDARSKGIPQLGSGQIYPVPESEIVVEPYVIPENWRKVYGLDVGWKRTAAVWIAENPVDKTWVAWSEHYQGQMEPGVHASSIRARGGKIPGVIDPAARGRTQNDGTQLTQQYRDLGLTLTLAKNAVDSGLYEVWQALSGGQLKIFKTLSNLLYEYRVYRRDEKGHIVKENDHLMDALRYVWVSGRDLAVHGIDVAAKPVERQMMHWQRAGGSGGEWMA